jgi:hypothetical protein
LLKHRQKPALSVHHGQLLALPSSASCVWGRPPRRLIFLQGVREMGWRGLPIPKDAEAWRQRVCWLRRAEGSASQLPDLEEQALVASVQSWMTPHLQVWAAGS